MGKTGLNIINNVINVGLMLGVAYFAIVLVGGYLNYMHFGS